MKIHIGTDHAGLELKDKITKHLIKNGYQVTDHGAYTYNPQDDYPAFCITTAEAVIHDQADGIKTLGIIFGGSGNGEQIAANKVKGIRAALVWNKDTAKLARQHNDANIISIGARQHTDDEVLNLIDLFIKEPFSDNERHVRRIQQIKEYEN